MITLKRLAAWAIELSIQAAMLGLFLLALYGDGGSFWKGWLAYFVGTVIILFLGTGYLITTATSRALWSGRKLWPHATVATALFLLHFEVLNVFLLGTFEPQDRMRIVIAGACIVCASTFLGGWLLRKWLHGGSSGPDPEHHGLVPGIRN
jgi:hypothetical protein